MSNREKLAFGLAVAAVVIVPGLASWVIHSLGHSTLGTITWMIGYGSGIIAMWYIWIRPLDLRPPSGRPPEDSESDH